MWEDEHVCYLPAHTLLVFDVRKQVCMLPTNAHTLSVFGVRRQTSMLPTNQHCHYLMWEDKHVCYLPTHTLPVSDVRRQTDIPTNTHTLPVFGVRRQIYLLTHTHCQCLVWEDKQIYLVAHTHCQYLIWEDKYEDATGRTVRKRYVIHFRSCPPPPQTPTSGLGEHLCTVCRIKNTGNIWLHIWKRQHSQLCKPFIS